MYMTRIPELILSSLSPYVGLILALSGMLCGIWTARRYRRRWSQPMRDLQATLARIRAGESSIEDLDAIRGGPRPLVDDVRDLLRELRCQRAQVVQLEQEMSHRIASRTGALERVVGTLKQQVTRDPLTGLHNRRMLDGCLAAAMERSRNEDWPLCLLMIDVDDFKLLNDTLGHAAGDELLRSLGQLIRSSLRDEDLAFRCGGDEFVVVLTNTDRRQGELIAGRLTSLVDAMGKMLHVERPPRLSIGLATPFDLGIDPTAATLLAEADKQLYAVKSGRKKIRQVA
jgi:diguanylate cyclase (GGDEF)-like protein